MRTSLKTALNVLNVQSYIITQLVKFTKSSLKYTKYIVSVHLNVVSKKFNCCFMVSVVIDVIDEYIEQVEKHWTNDTDLDNTMH